MQSVIVLMDGTKMSSDFLLQYIKSFLYVSSNAHTKEEKFNTVSLGKRLGTECCFLVQLPVAQDPSFSYFSRKNFEEEKKIGQISNMMCGLKILAYKDGNRIVLVRKTWQKCSSVCRGG